MRPLTLAAFLLAFFPALVWGPVQPYQTVIQAPRDYVLMQATRYRVPIPLALAIWEAESDMRVDVARGAKGERGAFQVTRRASIDSGCRWRWMDSFRVSVPCGMRFLAAKIQACRSLIRAAHAYNFGHCPHRGKPWGYALYVSRLIVKHSGVLIVYWTATLIGADRPQQTQWIRIHASLCGMDQGKFLWERGDDSITVLCVPIENKKKAALFS